MADLVLLTALCGLVYFTGLTTRGLANWQEAQRALVAREMQQTGDWIVPTIDGRTYLNKPPLFYWLTVAIAEARGARVGDLDLRLAVALCGWAGVIATYLVARRFLMPGPTEDPGYPRRAALWSGLFLATGILYVRSSRIGELDIAIVPFAVAAIGGVHAAWRSHLQRARTDWAAVAIAAVCAAGTMLAKGPPALMVIALAAYGGIALRAGVDSLALGSENGNAGWNERLRALDGPLLRALGGYIVGAIAFMAAGVWCSWRDSSWADRITGLILLDPMGGVLGAIAALLATRTAARSLGVALVRTHPWIVLGVPVAALWGWLAAARARIGDGPVEGTIRGEAEGNLRLFELGAPMNNVEALAYGVGAGSLAALVACAWLARTRPRLTPGFSVIIAWIAFGLIAFSVLGKGVPRYLTPVWPAVAMLGGAWFAWRPAGRSRPRLTRALMIGGVAGLAIGQMSWYGFRGAEQSHSPREFLAELLAPPHSVGPTRLGTFEFDTPQVDFYADHRVESFVDAVQRPGLAGVGPRTISELRAQLARERASFTLLIRAAQPDFLDPEPAVDRLRSAGFTIEPIDLDAAWRIDNDRTAVVAVRIRAGPREM